MDLLGGGKGSIDYLLLNDVAEEYDNV